MPAPAVNLEMVELVDGGWLVGSPSTLFPSLPMEFVLRELEDLDLDVDEDLVEFLCRHGVVRIRAEDFAVAVPAWLRLDRPADAVGHVVPTRQRLGWLRAVARTWSAHLLDEYLLPAWVGADDPPGEESEVWDRCVDVLNVGLQDYAMRASADPGDTTVVVDLYAAGCVQVANLMNELLPPHRCRNERCGRAFVRQRDGAVQGQFRTTGVSYCSPTCQKAQAQREWRRKRKGSK